jgi:O-antigen/teichoic acid export membrane protein
MGASTGLIALVVPPFLSRSLTPAEFGAWALAQQIASYVLLLGFGMQTAVGRFVALARGPEAAEDKHAVVVAGFHLSLGAAFVGVALAGVAAVAAPHFLTDLPPDLVADFRIALALCGGSAALGLIGMPFTGIFLGEQRAHVPASILLGGRFAQCALLVFAALRFGSLRALAIAFVAGQLAILAAQVVSWRKDPVARASRLFAARPTLYRELLSFCAPFVLWNLLAGVSFGSDLIIVSKVDFDQTPYYAVALTVATMFVGVLSAGYNSLLPAAARLFGAGDRAALYGLLLRAGRGGVGASLAVGVPLIFGAVAPLALWIGESYAHAAAPYVAVLISAQIVRLALSMYGSVTIATGRHRAVLLAPVLDAVAGLSLGIGLGLAFGAIGVAIGMVAGAAVNLVIWCVKDPLEAIFGGGNVARAFLRACATPAAAAVIGLAALAIAARYAGWPPESIWRSACSLVVAALVALVAFAGIRRGPIGRVAHADEPVQR